MTLQLVKSRNHIPGDEPRAFRPFPAEETPSRLQEVVFYTKNFLTYENSMGKLWAVPDRPAGSQTVTRFTGIIGERYSMRFFKFISMLGVVVVAAMFVSQAQAVLVVDQTFEGATSGSSVDTDGWTSGTLWTAVSPAAGGSGSTGLLSAQGVGDSTMYHATNNTDPFDGTEVLTAFGAQIHLTAGFQSLRIAPTYNTTSAVSAWFGVNSGASQNLAISSFFAAPVVGTDVLDLGKWYDIEMRVTKIASGADAWAGSTGSLFFRESGSSSWTAAAGVQDVFLQYDAGFRNSGTFDSWNIRGSGNIQFDNLSYGIPAAAVPEPSSFAFGFVVLCIGMTASYVRKRRQ